MVYRETPLTTPRFLREHREQILREWEALVAREPRKVTLSGAILRDSVPELLDELADWLALAPHHRGYGRD